MSVRIKKLGSDPAKKVYEATCIRCRTEFSFQREDAEYWSSVRNEEGLKIPCPSCRRDVYVAL